MRLFGYHKLHAQWVSKMLSDVHKDHIMVSECAFFDHFHKERDEFFPHIITDETWILCINAES